MEVNQKIIQEVKTQSVYIPENWKKSQENKSDGFLNWLSESIKSIHYTNDQKVSDSLLNFNIK